MKATNLIEYSIDLTSNIKSIYILIKRYNPKKKVFIARIFLEIEIIKIILRVVSD